MQSERLQTPFEGGESAEDPSSVILEGRLHPWTIALETVRLVRGFAITAITVAFVGPRSIWLWILAFSFAASLARVIARYVSFTYRIQNGELITRQGVFGRRERSIRLERIQEVSTEQGVLERILGVVKARIETAGGSGGDGPETSLEVLSLDDVNILRAAVTGWLASHGVEKQTSELTVELAAPEVVLSLSLRDLIVAGLTSNFLVTALLFLAGLWALVDDIVPERFYQRLAEALYGYAGRLSEEDPLTAIWVGVVGILAILVVGAIASVVGSIILYYGFDLRLRGDTFYRIYGLLTRRASSIQRNRVQLVEIEQGFLRRQLGYAAMKVDVAGTHTGEGKSEHAGQNVLVPICPEANLESLAQKVFPQFDGGDADWRPVSQLAIRRATFEAGIVLLLVALAAGIYTGSWWWLGLLSLVGPVHWINIRRYAEIGYSFKVAFFRSRRGWLGRVLHIVPTGKVQVVEIRENLIDRRLGLATLVCDTAGRASTNLGPRVNNLPATEAISVGRQLARIAAGYVVPPSGGIVDTVIPGVPDSP
jgi:putative membrane protein